MGIWADDVPRGLLSHHKKPLYLPASPNVLLICPC